MKAAVGVKAVTVLCAVFTLSSIAWANPPAGKLEVKTIVEKEVVVANPDGSRVRKRIPAGTVIPGDEVIYTIRVKNVSEAPVADVAITDPVPENTRYQPESASGASTEIQFSVDGGASYHPRDALKVKLPDGTERPARAADYTHIRWKFTRELAAGATREVQFRAKLL